jgi:hypothetical protein
MTGAQALAKLERRLGLHAVTDERYNPPFLLDALTEARDKMVRTFAQGAPILVQKSTDLEVQADDRIYEFPRSSRSGAWTISSRSARPSVRTTRATMCGQRSVS